MNRHRGRGQRLLGRLVRPESTGQPIRPTRVLVVDDDAVIRALITATLSAEGFDVFEAVDGVAALVSVGSTEPDIVTLDSDMPPMSGWDVAQMLRTNPPTASIRTLVLASRPPDLSSGFALPTGVDGCIRKPFDAHELVTAVKQLAAPQRRRRSGLR